MTLACLIEMRVRRVCFSTIWLSFQHTCVHPNKISDLNSGTINVFVTTGHCIVHMRLTYFIESARSESTTRFSNLPYAAFQSHCLYSFLVGMIILMFVPSLLCLVFIYFPSSSPCAKTYAWSAIQWHHS